jgi:hypothetical protein
MVLSKRERQILIVTISVVAAFLLYQFIATPIFNARAEILAERQGLIREMEKASALFQQKSQITPVWNKMLNGGLNSDVSSTESMVLNALRIWAQDYGLTLSSIKPEREKGENDIIKEIQFNVSCSGSISSVAQFLFQIESSTLPLRIKDFQLGSREEDGKEMSLQLKLSALYLAGAAEATALDAQLSEEERNNNEI